MSSSSVRIALQRGQQGVTLAAADALLDALQTHGYCYLQHPALPVERLSSVKVTGQRFFSELLPSLTEYQKASIATDGGFRGFYRYVGASGRDDAIDCFSIGRDDVDDDVAGLRRQYFLQAGWERGEVNAMLARTNPWAHMVAAPSPAETSASHHKLVNEIRLDLVAYYNACHEVCMDVLRHVAAGLGIKAALNTGVEGPDSTIDWEYFARHHSKRDHNLEVKHYPAFSRALRARPLVPVHGASVSNPSGPKVLRRRGAAASPLVETPSRVSAAGTADVGHAAASSPVVRLDTHKDLSTLTLLAQDQLGGLEVLDEAQDAYVPVPVMADAVLVNAGTFLEKWTGGLLPATPHRVRCTGEVDRCSVVFFCFPDHDAWIEPLLAKDDNPVLTGPESAGFFAGDLMPPMPKPS